MRLIDSEKLIERMNNAEENFKADHIEAISSDDGDPFVDGVLSGVFSTRSMVTIAPTIPAIPMERIKQLREEIEKLPNRNPSYHYPDDLVDREDTLELIDDMIKEYSE